MKLYLDYNPLVFQSSIKDLSQFLTESQKSHLLERGIFTVEDLLWYFPTRYESRYLYHNLKHLSHSLANQEEIDVTLSIVCQEKNFLFMKRFRSKNIPQFIFGDGTNPHRVVVTGYNPKHRRFVIGNRYILIGRLKTSGKLLEFVLQLKEHQQTNKNNDINVREMTPIYRSIKTISSENLRNIINDIFKNMEKNKEIIYYDPCVPSGLKLTDKLNNLKQIHFPKSTIGLKRARKQLALEELFIFQTKVLERKKEKRSHRTSTCIKDKFTKIVEKSLPYKLRDDQKRVFQEIKNDLQKSHAMSRLLQGEVGCGKTVLCLLACVFVAENGKQSVMLAPTEILARQHYNFFQKYIQKTSIKVGFFSRSSNISQEIADGEFSIIVATHAALQKNVVYKNLGLVVLDEQQRFGVQQREEILQKGDHVDLLMVSATPIPHSLGLILYGDLDISEVKNHKLKPRNSKLIQHEHRLHAYKFLKQQVKKSEQGLIIFPLLEDNGKEDHISLLKEYEYIQKSPLLEDISIGIIHGKLPDIEKQNIMQSFVNGEIQIICSTSILEVGIDNPNATVIIIEGAERFGLCQLHQMRGRVGRGKKEGYCYVVASENCSTDSLTRLAKFCKTHDGFELANIDLSFRGYGDILGTQQSGLPKFKIANCPGEDLKLLLCIKNFLETGTTIDDAEYDIFE